MSRITKPRGALVLAIITAALTALVLGVTGAFSSDNAQPAPTASGSADIAPAAGQTPTIHVPQTVDGQQWLVKTYENQEGELCFAEVVPEEGTGVGCRTRSEFFGSGPVYFGIGARQHADTTDLTHWANIWVDGLVTAPVSALEIVMTDCSVVEVTPDADGVFLAVFGESTIGRNVWPHELVALDGSGSVVQRDTLDLQPPSTQAAISAGVQAPQPRSCST